MFRNWIFYLQHPLGCLATSPYIVKDICSPEKMMPPVRPDSSPACGGLHMQLEILPSTQGALGGGDSPGGTWGIWSIWPLAMRTMANYRILHMDHDMDLFLGSPLRPRPVAGRELWSFRQSSPCIASETIGVYSPSCSGKMKILHKVKHSWTTVPS